MGMISAVAMCAGTCDSLGLLDECCTDEDVILFLGERKLGDPVPSNVITEVNPFCIEPWDLPENIWYLYSTEVSRSYSREKFIKSTDNGYWRPMSDLTIVTSTPSVGQKTTREFFLGKEPLGDRTGWVMHEYQAEEKSHSGANKDCTSLCRVFLQHELQTNTSEQDTHVTADHDIDKHLDVKLLEQEETEPLENHSNGLQACIEDWHRRPSSSERNSQTSVAHKFVEDTTASNDFSDDDFLELSACNMEASSSSPLNSVAYDFSKGDYLELNDLYSSETSSSSSDNSSFMSGNPDEYFDPDALLRDISCENDLNFNEERGCKFSVSASVRPDNVVMGPTPQGLVHCNNWDLVVEEAVPGSVPSTSAAEIVNDANASPSGTSEGRLTNQSPSLQDEGSPQRLGSRSAGRMAKLRKKYLCFGPF